MIQGMFEYGALPAAERLVQFTAARHRVLQNNVANLSTPYYQPRDLNPQSFQNALSDAIDQRRQSIRPGNGPLPLRSTSELRFEADRLEVSPSDVNQGVTFHDQSNRDLERTMQHMAENAMAHRLGVELTRNHFTLLSLAIRERA